jgi:hypothetical protein
MVYATLHNEKKSSRLNPLSKGGEGYSINVLIPINEDKTQKVYLCYRFPHTYKVGERAQRGEKTRQVS